MFRSHGGLVFLSVCLGSVLATYVAGDASTIISGASRSSALATIQWTQIGLLFTPVVLTLLLARKKLKGLKLILGTFAAAAGGGLLALLLTPYLSQNLQQQIRREVLWHQLDSLQVAIIITGTLVTMLLLFIMRWKPDGDKKKHKK